jgi:DNA-binding CsgD family transcriptional regulator
MRATMHEYNADLATILRAVFDLAGIPLSVVIDEQEFLLSAIQARGNDFLVLDCSSGAVDDVRRASMVIARTQVPLHIIHPRPDFVREIGVAAGRAVHWLSPDFPVLTLLDKLRFLRVTAAPNVSQIPLAMLSPRERTVLRLLATEGTNHAIASALGCSESTIKSHIAQIKEKMAVASRHELVQLYRLSCPA